MKRPVLLGLALLMAGVFARAQSPPNAPRNSAGGYEMLKMPVLKVYSVQDGPAAFHAYVVKWHDTEVIASDRLGTTSFKEGDTIDVMVMRHEMNQGGQEMHTLNFEVLPVPRFKKAVALGNLQDQGGVMNGDHPKAPSYLDCRADSVVVYPGKMRVTWEELQQPGNNVEQLLDRVQAHKDAEYVVVMVRPQSVKFYRMVRTLASRRPINVGYEVVDAEFQVEWDEARNDLAVAEGGPEAPKALPPRVREVPAAGPIDTPVWKPTPRAVLSNKQPVFFECRGNEVFFVDKEGLDAQVAKLLSTVTADVKKGEINQFLKAVQAQEIGNEYYKVSPNYLLAAIVALEPRPGVHGERSESLDQPNGKFQSVVKNLNSKTQTISFLVREDSFDAFRHARKAAFKAGFESGWELLGVDEPIKFGSERSLAAGEQ